MFVPVAINAGTTYGIDNSPQNNYGSGPTFYSSALLAKKAATKKQQPSLFWLLAIAVLVGLA